MTDIITVEAQDNRPMLDMRPQQKIEAATEIANILAKVIRKQGFSQKIHGKEFVKCEGWLTLGTLLGVTPKEKRVEEMEDGSYVAEVELVRVDTGRVIGGASALCSVDEKRWRDADKYARRSMAVTRATGKSFRISFGWIIGLAGFEPTNSEEMPENDIDIYTGSDDEKGRLKAYLQKVSISESYLEEINKRMLNKDKREITEVIKEVVNAT